MDPPGVPENVALYKRPNRAGRGRDNGHPDMTRGTFSKEPFLKIRVLGERTKRMQRHENLSCRGVMTPRDRGIGGHMARSSTSQTVKRTARRATRKAKAGVAAARRRVSTAARKAKSKVARTAKPKARAAQKVKARVKAKVKSVKSKVTKAAKQTAAAARKAKAKVVRRESKVARQMKTAAAGMKKTVKKTVRALKPSRPSKTETLVADLKQVGDDLSTLGEDVMALGRKTVNAEVDSLRESTRDFLVNTANKI